MDVPIDGDRLAERPVDRLQPGIARFRPGRPPAPLGTGVHERHRTMHLNARQAAQPGEPLFSQRFTGGHRHLLDRGEEGLELGRLAAMAAKMPPENYAFKATPDVRTFGELIAHVADTQMRTCASVVGEQKTADAASKTAKNDLVAALKASFDEC